MGESPSPAARPEQVHGLAAEYLPFLHEAEPLTRGEDPALLIEAGRDVCRRFDEGATDLELLHEWSDAAPLVWEGEQDGWLGLFTALVLGATEYLCPEHRDKVAE